MQKLSYAQFAKALGISRASVTMAVKQERIIADSINKLIDPKEPSNRVWIDKQVYERGRIWDVNAIFEEGNDRKLSDQKPPAKQKVIPEEKIEYVELPLDEHTRKLRELDYDKRKIELRAKNVKLELDEIQIRKLKGDLIPVDAVKSVFIFAIEALRTSYIQEVNAIASIFVERLGADEVHYKELQKEISEKTNQIMKDTKDIMISGLSDAIDSYKETRSRGQRK